MAGRTEVGVFSISVVESLICDGALRAIAVPANKKSTALPDVPLISATLPGFDLGGWFMLMAPAFWRTALWAMTTPRDTDHLLLFSWHRA
jgi:tripartite-type tricarboxylate transporter receptor subunit TctC